MPKKKTPKPRPISRSALCAEMAKVMRDRSRALMPSELDAADNAILRLVEYIASETAKECCIQLGRLKR